MTRVCQRYSKVQALEKYKPTVLSSFDLLESQVGSVFSRYESSIKYIYIYIKSSFSDIQVVVFGLGDTQLKYKPHNLNAPSPMQYLGSISVKYGQSLSISS